MTDKRHEQRPGSGSFSRRALVQAAGGAAACGLGGCTTSTKVQGNAPHTEAQYQDRPSGLERCGVCKHFIPLTGCEIVAAPVQANGWCKYYALF